MRLGLSLCLSLRLGLKLGLKLGLRLGLEVDGLLKASLVLITLFRELVHLLLELCFVSSLARLEERAANTHIGRGHTLSGDFSKISFSNFRPISIIFWTVGGPGCEVLARRRFPML